MLTREELINALLHNDRFVKWVLDPATDDNSYWDHYRDQNPEQAGALEHARLLILQLKSSQEPDHTEQAGEEIWHRIRQTLEPDPASKKRMRMLPAIRWWPAAAAILTIAFIIGFISLRKRNDLAATSSNNTASMIPGLQLVRKNTSSVNQVIHLTDGSRVMLKPNSTLINPLFFTGNTREVTLTGEAFFEIARDTTHPFLVHAPGVVVKVLGTSFVVKQAQNNDLLVAVRTGKVAVLNKQAASPGNNHELILLPSQQVVINHTGKILLKGNVTEKDIIEKPGWAPLNFDFEEAPVTAVLKTIEETYAITINYDKEALSGCLITTSLGEESLKEKLDIICRAIGANYAMNENEVIITGRGCR